MTWIQLAWTFARGALRGGIAEVAQERSRPRPTPEDAARDQLRVRADLDRIEAQYRDAFAREKHV